jgi:hypothetical protein
MELAGFTGIVVLGVLAGVIMFIVAAKKSRKSKMQSSSDGLGLSQPNLRPDVGRPSYGPITDKDD